MKIRKIYRNRKNNKRKISFNTMINSEYFFRRSGSIQMALKKPEIIDEDFHIKRVKSTLSRLRRPKIFDNSNKKNNEENDTSFSNKEEDKKQLPLELGKILDDNEQKFLYINEKYNILKEENNKFLKHWHYIKKSRNNNKNKINLSDIIIKIYFEELEKYFVDLNSDEVQKFTAKLFKSNPLLMYRNSSDMFFHFLCEINQHKNDEKKLEYIMEKHLIFLEKLKNFLEYSKIKNDDSVDQITKDVKLKNSDYIANYNLKVQKEEQKMKDKEIQNNINEINDSLKMINATKKTIKSIEENKNLFEDPNYLIDNTINDYNQKSFYNSYSNLNFRNLNQSAKYSTNKMNSTISTGFNIMEKENKNIKLKGYRSSLTGKSRNSLSMMEKKIDRKSVTNNFSLMGKGVYERIISSRLVKNNMPEISNYGKIEKTNLKKILNKAESINLEYIKNDSNKNINEEIRKESNKDVNNEINLNIKKETPTNNDNNVNNKKKQFCRCNSVIKINKNNFVLNDKNEIKFVKIFNKDENQKKITKNYSRNKSMILSNKMKERQLTNLYNKIKNRKKISTEEEMNIVDYFRNVGKEINNREVKPIDLIIRSKLVVNRLDINKNTAKVLQQNISRKLVDNLKVVKNINKKVNSLDIDFLKNVIFFKAKDENDVL